jgi:predicted enzyme related to lactoylglutathione lyase
LIRVVKEIAVELCHGLIRSVNHLEVDDVYQTQKEFAKRQIEFTEAPRTEPWGGWAMFKDSEGNIHGLHSPAAVSAVNR